MSIRAVLKVALDKAHADMEEADAAVNEAETALAEGGVDLVMAQDALEQARARWAKADDDINNAYDALKEIDQLEGKPPEYWIELSRAGKL